MVSRLGTVLPRVMRSPPLLVTVSLTEAIFIRRHRNDASRAVSLKASERLNSTPWGREISLNIASIDVPVVIILISIPMFARSVGLNVANIGTLAILNAHHATWCESRQQPLGRYRARSFHQPWDSTMKKPLAVAVVELSFAPSCVLGQERAGDAALGALSGAVVLGIQHGVIKAIPSNRH